MRPPSSGLDMSHVSSLGHQASRISLFGEIAARRTLGWLWGRRCEADAALRPRRGCLHCFRRQQSRAARHRASACLDAACSSPASIASPDTAIQLPPSTRPAPSDWPTQQKHGMLCTLGGRVPWHRHPSTSTPTAHHLLGMRPESRLWESTLSLIFTAPAHTTPLPPVPPPGFTDI